jgi:hypothetical protein
MLNVSIVALKAPGGLHTLWTDTATPGGTGYPGGKYSELQVLETCTGGKSHVEVVEFKLAPSGHGKRHVEAITFHVAPAGHAQGEVAPAALLSVNSILGDVPPKEQQPFGTKLRLFVSPVLLSNWLQTGAGSIGLPAVLRTLVATTIVDPRLNWAWDPSPETENVNANLPVAILTHDQRDSVKV